MAAHVKRGLNVQNPTQASMRRSKFSEKLQDGLVRCVLCPRACKIPDGSTGFCKVRRNVGGELYSLNYGLSTYMVIEPVETNAVFHYYPGEQALALGTIGCNLDCSFCQAWEYSKIKSVGSIPVRFFDNYSPEQIVDKAREKGLGVISWTFNDPMSWFEFVLDTARIAKKNGIVSIFKSNHYVNEAPLEELAGCVDVFSISIKSIEDQFYKDFCNASLEPVLKSARVLKKLGKHIEISNLVIPTLNDSDEQFSSLIAWIKENLGTDTPLHFARYHPDYQLLSIPRTPVATIERAISIARANGMKHVYAGNMLVEDDSNNTYCTSCSALLVRRKGGRPIVVNKSPTCCDNCKRLIPITFRADHEGINSPAINYEEMDFSITYEWREEVYSVHVQVVNNTGERREILVRNILGNGTDEGDAVPKRIHVSPRERIRYTFNRIGARHEKSVISFEDGLDVRVFENLDRAYYGTCDVKKGR